MLKQFYTDMFPQDDSNKLIWTLSDKRSHWFKDIDKMMVFIKDNPHNIFYGLGVTKKKKTKYERALITEISSIRYFHLDIDIKSDVAHKKDNLPATIEEARAIAHHILEPTYLINSGHGLHALFALDEHYQIDDLEYITALIQQFQEAHRKAFPQYDLDYTHDITRILRCPGSINSKDPDNQVDCEIIEYNKDAYYMIEMIDDAIEFDPDKVDSPPAANTTTKSGTKNAKYTAMNGNINTKGWSTRDYVKWFNDQGLVIDKTASIDADIWIDLASADPSFVKAYNHEFDKVTKSNNPAAPDVKKKEIDTNKYDMTLANIGAKYGLPDQTIVDLLIMHRRKYGVNLAKLNRKDYFARTLIKCGILRSIGLIAKKKSQNKSVSKNDLHTVRVYLENVLKCAIGQVIRYGKDPNPQFELVLDDLPGKTIKLGSFSEGILNQRNFRAKIGAMGVTMPLAVKQPKWEGDIIPNLQLLTIEGIVPSTATYEGQIKEWVTEYLITKTITEDLPAFIEDDSMGQPFYHDERVYFQLENLQTWIRTSKNHNTDFSFVTSMIGYGFLQENITNKNKIKVRLWATPKNFFPK